MTDALELKGKDRILTWLFNPFHFIAGGPALALGLLVILGAGLAASVSNSHFDGVLDFHTGLPVPIGTVVLEGLIDWLALAVPLLVAGLLLSKSRIRVVDVLGTQALARIPTVFTAEVGLLTFFPGFGRQMARLMQGNLEVVPLDMALIAVLGIVTVVMMVWMIALMYRAFTVACNVHGGKAAIAFVCALLLGEVLSKIAIVNL